MQALTIAWGRRFSEEVKLPVFYSNLPLCIVIFQIRCVFHFHFRTICTAVRSISSSQVHFIVYGGINTFVKTNNYESCPSFSSTCMLPYSIFCSGN